MDPIDMIVAKDLWKVYLTGKVEYPALRGINVTINKGDFVAIVGPSGSGKSTLLNVFSALDRPTKGMVLIEGVDISKLSDNKLAKLRNKKLGFVFQSYNLIQYINALENVEVPLIASRMRRGERLERAKSLLETVGLKGLERNRPSELSGGQQQRVAIARALSSEPQILMADEPTGNLDSASSAEIMALLCRLNHEKTMTIVMVTHNLELTHGCNRIIYVKDGLIDKEVKKNAS